MLLQLLLYTLPILAAVLLIRRKFSTLPPGPTGVPILGMLPFLSPELHSYLASLATTHGPIFHLPLGFKPTIIISSPTLARAVLTDPVFSDHDVPAFGAALTYGALDIVWSSGDTWRLVRKICVRDLLGGSTLEGMYGLRRRGVRGMVRRLKHLEGSEVNLTEQFFDMAMGVVASMLWGGKGEEVEWEEEFRGLIGEVVEMLAVPNVSDFFPFLRRFDLQGVERRALRLRGRIDGIFDRIIEGRVEGEGRDGDFVDVLVRMERVGGDGKVQFTRDHTKALLLDMVTGGVDTTSTTLEWAMAELIQNTTTLRKAQQELDDVVGPDALMEENHISKLPYLAAVAKETLRLHPVLPLLIPHRPNQPATIDKYNIPLNARILVNAWAIHRDPALWEEPLVFRPERFLEGDGLNLTGKDFRYLPFGTGRRICAGVGLAERMVLYSLGSLLHSFDWQVKAGGTLDMEEKFGIVLKRAKPLVVVPTRRLSKEELYV